MNKLVAGLLPSFLTVSLAATAVLTADVLAQVSAGDASRSPVAPNVLSGSVFSLAGGKRLVAEAMEAAGRQRYDTAIAKMQDARQVFNQLSNFYQDLTASFAGIDNRIADSHRQQALAAAVARDEATYQLAVIYRANNQPELAIPLLVQLIRSQQPTRELGRQAYQQLFELGFVNEAFPRTGAAAAPQ
ncbi:MAG: hypothetical protein ACUVSQ_01460 [Pseudanabaenaceae cyanobacterium]